MRPLVGIPCYLTQRPGTSRPIYATNQTYVRAIEDTGGAPVLLPLYEHPETLQALYARLDGLLLAGGGDVDPARYGESPIPQTEAPESARDAIEIELIDRALRDGLAILGICRGMQVLNVACGGSLVQDIAVQVSGAQNHDLGADASADRTHPIAIQSGSRLAAILGDQRHEVNSFHHQAVDRPGKGVRIVARTLDGVAEALEVPDHPFCLAVQFHPERQYTSDPALRRLFAAFVRACQTRLAHPAPPTAALAGAPS